MNANSPWILLAPLLLVGFGGFAMMLVDAFSKTKSELATLGAVVLFAAGAIAAVLASGHGPSAAPVGIAPFVSVGPMSQFFNLTICAGGGMAALLAGGYLPEHALERGELY